MAKSMKGQNEMELMNESERTWKAHCTSMKAAYETEAAALIAEGWQRMGAATTAEHFTRNGQKLVLRRRLGKNNWYRVTML